MTRRRVAPSRLRYESSHPCISFRLTQEELRGLREIQQRTGLSLAEIARRSIRVHRRQTGEAYERGRKAGYAEGFGQLEVPCSVCNRPMRFDLNSANHAKAAEAVRRALSGWSHTKCPESRA